VPRAMQHAHFRITFSLKYQRTKAQGEFAINIAYCLLQLLPSVANPGTVFICRSLYIKLTGH